MFSFCGWFSLDWKLMPSINYHHRKTVERSWSSHSVTVSIYSSCVNAKSNTDSRVCMLKKVVHHQVIAYHLLKICYKYVANLLPFKTIRFLKLLYINFRGKCCSSVHCRKSGCHSSTKNCFMYFCSQNPWSLVASIKIWSLLYLNQTWYIFALGLFV